MFNILVTGGCGFIGSNFINNIKEKYPSFNIINLDKFDYCSNINNIKEGYAETIKGDICDKDIVELILKKYDIKVVFHFAALSHVDNSFIDPISFTKNNTYGTHVLMETIKNFNPTMEIIHFSTDEVYGENTNGIPFTENDILKPTNPYSASKAAAEMVVMSYIQSYKMNVKIIRCNNVYGPNQYPEKLIPKFKKLLKNNEKCTIHGDKSAQVKRAFIHVDDVVDAVDIIWKRGAIGETYNISSEHEISVMELTKLMIEKLKNTKEYDKYISYVKDRPFNDQRYLIDCQKLKDLGWIQKRNLNNLMEFISTY